MSATGYNGIAGTCGINPSPTYGSDGLQYAFTRGRGCPSNSPLMPLKDVIRTTCKDSTAAIPKIQL